MKALIFAAGLGTRLKPLTDTMPKALVPIHGRPLLDITIRRLIDAGADNICVNIHHFGQQIVDYLASHSYGGATISISDERSLLLDTGGGLRQALQLMKTADTPLLIHNVDILHNADLRAFFKASIGNDVTLMVSERTTQRYLLFDDDMRLVGWTNLATGEVRSPHPNLDPNTCKRYAFSGIHCFSPANLPLLETYPERFPIMDFYLSECAKLGIKGHVVPDLKLVDVGKLDTLAQAEQMVDEKM